MAIQIGYARMHIDDGGDGAQRLLARFFFQIDEGLRQLALIARTTGNIDRLILLGAVDERCISSVDVSVTLFEQ